MKVKDWVSAFPEKHPRISKFASDYRGELITVAVVVATVVVIKNLPTVDRLTFVLTLKGK